MKLSIVQHLTVIVVSISTCCNAVPGLRSLSDEQQTLPEDPMIWERILENSSYPQPTREPTRPPFVPPPQPTLPPSPTPPPTQPPIGGPFPCDIPPERRAALLTEVAEGVSGPISQGTPQGQALNWLIRQDAYLVCPDDPKAYQRYILALFYYSAEGDKWDECSAPDDFDDPDSIARANDNCSVTTTPIAGGSNNPSFKETTEGRDAWLTPVYECEWAGITCRVEGECVDRIEFEGNGVGGVLPYELRDLGDLRFLILERGTTSGTIPSQFGQIEDLLFLDLDFNELTGTIPDEIYDLDGLFQLDLNDNLLTGTISPLIGNLDQLIFLQLAGNDFTGQIPQELENLTNLLTGSFEFTELRGEIPRGLCRSLETKPSYVLIADCNPQGNNPPKVKCDCCTDCYPL